MPGSQVQVFKMLSTDSLEMHCDRRMQLDERAGTELVREPCREL
jgi:hypothetical protein